MKLYDRLLLGLVLAGSLIGCQERRVEVSDPFYLDYIEKPESVDLRVCGDHGCADIEGLPSAGVDGVGPHVVAAGANRAFIAVKQKQIGDRVGAATYYYFPRQFDPLARGAPHPRIVDPLSEQQFLARKVRLGLPELAIKP